MAYAVALDTECTEAGCHRRATYEVRDAWNATIRKCCRAATSCSAWRPTRTIPISSFTLHTTKENTAMPTEPRPTKAQVTELRELLERRERQLQEATMDLRTSEDRRKELLAGDLEARCLDQCVRAIEAMRAAEAERNRNQSNYGYATLSSSYADRDPRPEALGDPIGRILLHLAARYGQAIGAIPPPPPPERAGQQLVSVPAHVAEQLERMPMHVWEQHQ
jgi:hypothetical protein